MGDLVLDMSAAFSSGLRLWLSEDQRKTRKKKKRIIRRTQRLKQLPLQGLHLTSGWHCVLKHLVELAEVHDHGELVRLHHGGHLLAGHAGRDAELPLGHVERQLVVLLQVLLVQRVKVTVGTERGRSASQCRGNNWKHL